MEDVQQCNGQYNIRLAVFAVSLFSFMFDCFKFCKRDRIIYELEEENRSLKRRIMNSIDNTLVRIIENGNQTRYGHED